MNVNDAEVNNWIRRYAPHGDTAVRLVCFPHAGGSASFFHSVALKLPANVDVVALQYPGRQDRRREPTIDDIGEYTDQITPVLETMSSKPTVFFGHSMGAVLAFEVARRLERASANAPRSLIASGRRGPSTYREETVHLRDDSGIIDEIKLLNGTNAALLGDEEILRMALPAIRSDYRAIETYTCRPEYKVRCPITVLIGDSDPKTTVEEAQSWQRHTTSPFRLRTFSGGHFYLSDHQSEVTAEIETELRKISLAPMPKY